jgi:hypothetical protein
MQCDPDVTYEPDAAFLRPTYLSADGSNQPPAGWNAATNLPASYVDTTSSDPSCCHIWTIGTDDADKLEAGKRYWTIRRTFKGPADLNLGEPQGQLGYHRFDHCPHFEVQWCVFSRPAGTVDLMDTDPSTHWEYQAPGTALWTR